MTNKRRKLIGFLKNRSGLAGYSEIKKAGFDKTVLRSVVKSGQIKKVDRGLYRLAEGTQLSNPDLVAASIKVPKGIVCLLSALAFHEATSEIPRYVHIAILRGKHANKIKYPPVKYYRYAPGIWKEGLENHEVDGRRIRVYNLARTVVDCFKFRNKIGLDVARDALKVAVTEKEVKPKEIMKYAKLCRVESVIKPVLEAII
ncbi:MAG: transcriptional regulator [Candidatus Margulisbacteria bacterium]|nr:transcriptional regulator [Candidatus Margulisiibacteriota bacterium]